MLERVPSGEAGDEVPDFAVVGMEDVGAVVVDADAVVIPVVMAVATDMGTLVDDGDAMTLLRKQPCCGTAADAGTDDEDGFLLILFVFTTFPFRNHSEIIDYFCFTVAYS